MFDLHECFLQLNPTQPFVSKAVSLHVNLGLEGTGLSQIRV